MWVSGLAPVVVVDRLSSAFSTGVRVAVSIGTDRPAIADTCLGPNELAQIADLHVRIPNYGEDLLDVPPETASRQMFDLKPGPVLEALTLWDNALKQIDAARTIRTAEDLGRHLFPDVVTSGAFMPLDEAIACVQGFRENAQSARLQMIGRELAAILLNGPGKILVGHPSQLYEPKDLAQSLWGASDALRPKDEAELISKLQHLAAFGAQIDSKGMYREAALVSCRRVLLQNVDYLSDLAWHLSSKELRRAILLSNLDGSEQELSIPEKVQRYAAVAKVLDSSKFPVVQLIGAAQDAKLDLTKAPETLNRVHVGISKSALRTILNITENPLRDPAFRTEARRLRLNVSSRAAEVGGLLFGQRQADDKLIVTHVIGYAAIEISYWGGRPTLSPDQESTKALISKMHEKGLEFLGDWHFHPHPATPFPSRVGDPDVYRGLVGERFREGDTCLQLITQLQDGKAVISPYLLYPLSENRFVRAPEGAPYWRIEKGEVVKVSGWYGMLDSPDRISVVQEGTLRGSLVEGARTLVDRLLKRERQLIEVS
ncbi:MAG: Mov34/MPN/PAD-1 family protein [Oligoflexia bacterium]|nr:Mov34/MPN/PAD-1 family protein [Oligoflexia bacterium]